MTWALALGRSSFAIALGILLGAAAVVLGVGSAARERVLVIDAPPVASSGGVRAAPPPDPVTIVDVSRAGIEQTGAVSGLVAMFGVGRDEALISVGGRPALHGFDALDPAWRAARPGDFLDLELAPADPTAPHRRILILVHP